MRHTPLQMMDTLLHCAEEALQAEDRLEGLCRRGFQPGNMVVQDYGAPECGGMLYVQLITAHPSTRFPSPVTEWPNCTHTLSYEFVVGVVRPAAIPQQGGRQGLLLPSEDQLREDTAGQVFDMEALYRAIICASTKIDMVRLGSYTPYGPEGGTVGGQWSVDMGNQD